MARLARGQQSGGVLYRLDDLHIAGAAADVAAQRLADFPFSRMGVATQQPGGSHNEARCAIPALGAELLMEATLHGGEGAALAERLDGIDPLARNRCCQSEARER